MQNQPGYTICFWRFLLSSTSKELTCVGFFFSHITKIERVDCCSCKSFLAFDLRISIWFLQSPFLALLTVNSLPDFFKSVYM
ncbi:hypothetical protein RchiOBHm_Chr2g0142301 [Rosa chinensis]|uniref:Uncharacterized protein n=1 Tax=Rosa chinensis TaxID=74649 RepID=A0A2P6RXU3_ROSCH|nr:hypothetical protein RchiOBHm_Chr2g0142301 [Rosa chinensis]